VSLFLSLPFAFSDTEVTLRGVFALAVPEAFLLALACVIYLGGTVRANRHLWAAVALAGLGIAFVIFWNRVPSQKYLPTVSPLWPDELADLVREIAFGGGAILTLLFWDEVRDEQAADFHACVLILVAGLSLLGAANDLITIFLALELISIPTYILLYLPRVGARPQEAAVKYFLLSIFSSGLLLFGFSYLYGAHGKTNLAEIFQLQLDHSDSVSSLTTIALVMIVAGLGFRITAVPFHFYAPDVFEGAPTSVAAMLAFVPKVAGFTALVRLLGFMHGAKPGLVADAQVAQLFWLLATITMTAGNILALLQDNLKRILAYSSVAHGGYMLIGLAAAPHLRATGAKEMHGTEAVFFYLIAYGAMTIGAFAVLHYLRSPERPVETVDDLAGLGRAQPPVALAMAVFLFSLIGLPLTAGFTGKFLLFLSAIEAEDHRPEGGGLFIALAVIGALNAAIGAYYYLRIIAAMYLRDALKPPRPAYQVAAPVAIAACVVLTIALGVYPTPALHAIRNALTGGWVATPADKTTALR
jgi:NADH-quinone oxidoreductase subunit N